jgi:cytochrome b involved in lipid metabolism
MDMEEVQKHNTPEDAWCVLNGRVYNITPYLDFHPGGRRQLLRVAGKDGSELFGN